LALFWLWPGFFFVLFSGRLAPFPYVRGFPFFPLFRPLPASASFFFSAGFPCQRRASFFFPFLKCSVSRKQRRSFPMHKPSPFLFVRQVVGVLGVMLFSFVFPFCEEIHPMRTPPPKSCFFVTSRILFLFFSRGFPPSPLVVLPAQLPPFPFGPAVSCRPSVDFFFGQDWQLPPPFSGLSVQRPVFFSPTKRAQTTLSPLRLRAPSFPHLWQEKDGSTFVSARGFTNTTPSLSECERLSRLQYELLVGTGKFFLAGGPLPSFQTMDTPRRILASPCSNEGCLTRCGSPPPRTPLPPPPLFFFFSFFPPFLGREFASHSSGSPLFSPPPSQRKQIGVFFSRAGGG